MGSFRENMKLVFWAIYLWTIEFTWKNAPRPNILPITFRFFYQFFLHVCWIKLSFSVEKSQLSLYNSVEQWQSSQCGLKTLCSHCLIFSPLRAKSMIRWRVYHRNYIILTLLSYIVRRPTRFTSHWVILFLNLYVQAKQCGRSWCHQCQL